MKRSDKIIVAGGRDFDNYMAVCLALERHISIGNIIVYGIGNSTNILGKYWAEQNGFKVKEFSADWNKYGISAGITRNREMAVYANTLIAFWDGNCRDIHHMIKVALRKGLEVHVYRY